MKRLLAVTVALTVASLWAGAAEKTLEVSFGPVQELLKAKCASCHDWAGTADGIRAQVQPGSPDDSRLWQKVSKDLMPPDEPLSADGKALVKEWIAAGAPADGAAATDATSGATTDDGSAVDGAKPSTFLGFKSRTAFHMATGYASSALFLGAGIVGAVQWGTLIAEFHEYRDALGIEEEEISARCAAYIAALRDDPLHRALRWTHVGLLSAGEALYIADAVTGITMLTEDRPGLTPQDIHRYAFFTHGALMIAEVVLGIASSAFLDLGDHGSIVGVGAAHTAIGIAIPVVMLGAGIYLDSIFR